MRQCWNRQTGTFEGRVSLTYGFKSRLPHQERDFAFAKSLSFFVYKAAPVLSAAFCFKSGLCRPLLKQLHLNVLPLSFGLFYSSN